MSKNDPVARIRARALLDLEKRNRRLIPEDVVEAAKDTEHVLHDYFEWDDSVAGSLYRLDQARTLIREVKITTVYEDRVIIAPMYVSDPDPDRERNGYAALDVVKKKAVDARRVMHDEMIRIEGAINRAKSIAAVLGLSAEVDRMSEAFTALQRSLAA